MSTPTEIDAARESNPVARTASAAQRLLAEVEKAVVGKRDVLELVLAGLLADGHVLLDDVPGVAKTLMARSFAAAAGLDFSRVQFTPDVLPADITGATVLDLATNQPAFRPGPIFAQLVLADEVNRAPAKTQAALLEAMQERQVSIGGQTYPLEEPFLVMATQNPIEHEGTYPLPEAQLDRFLLKVRVDYPTRQEERQILEIGLNGRTPPGRPVATRDDLDAAIAAVHEVALDDALKDYIVQIVYATRRPAAYRMPDLQTLIAFGASPRASIALAQAARAHAFLQGRGYTTPADVKALAHDVLRHRIVLTYEAEAEELTTDDLIDRVLEGIEVP